MYSYEERIRAIKFYINCGYNAAYTVRKLGYPDVSQIPRWYKEYINNKDSHKERVKWLILSIVLRTFDFALSLSCRQLLNL